MPSDVPAVADPSPVDVVSTPVDGVEVLGALSPSRAGDFLSCPLLYRFRTIDRLPEQPSAAAARGTLVHLVLERIFDEPAAERTPERAQSLLLPAWESILEHEPALLEMFDADPGDPGDPGDDDAERHLDVWLASCRAVLARYFTLEDPRRLEPADRELYVETLLESRLLLRGIVDRLDVAPDGAVRISDYKGLAVDTRLPTPSGWTTMEQVGVGDQLLGADGRPTTVTAKSATHHRPCFRVTLRDGSSVVCDNVHLWRVTRLDRGVETIHVVDTDGLAAMHDECISAGRRNSLWVEASTSLQIDRTVDLPVDPWLLGAWLGDGASRDGLLTVGKADIDDTLTLIKERWPTVVHVRDEGPAYAVTLSRDEERCLYGHADWKPSRTRGRKRRCRLEAGHARLVASNLSFTAVLRDAGLLNRKHIPAAYLRASTQQRIDLVRGLLDTDGWWNRIRRRAGFTTTDDGLALDVIELLHTLGINATHFSKPYVNAVRPGRTWHVIEFTPTWFVPFSLPRKASAVSAGVTDLQRRLAHRRVIASVRPVESVPTQCVAVDAPDSMYLCGEGFIPTHNTGRAPGEGFESRALFQLRFYALAVWRTRGVVPSVLQLIYLGNGEILRYEPDEADLLATERKIEAVWRAIREATESGDWRPHRSPLCSWCSFRSICPEWGGTPPPLPRTHPTNGSTRNA